MTDVDVLDTLERELAAARDDLARAVERVDALVDLRSVAQELTARLGPLADWDTLSHAPADPVTRARITNLAGRLARTVKEHS